MRELTTHRCSDLCHLLGRAEPVEPRHQRRMQARRDRQCRWGNRSRNLRRFRSPPASKTAFVISSTNNGMPSVRSIMSFLMSAGSSLLPTTRSIRVPTSRCPSRLRARAVTCGYPTQSASNSGRNVTIMRTGSGAIRSTVRPNASRLVGSPQCASSTIVSTGLERARVANCTTSPCRFSAGAVRKQAPKRGSVRRW